MPDMSNLIKQASTPSIDLERIAAQGELQIAQAETAEQVATQNNLKQALEEVVNPLSAKFPKTEKSIEEHKMRLKKSEKDELEQRLAPIKEIDTAAEKFSKQNPELKKPILMLLANRLKDVKTKEELLDILSQFYPDASLADEALRFLLETTKGSLHKLVEEAKQFHEEQFGREIAAGKNISEEVQKYSKDGLGEPTQLRDMYRDITGNPREPVQLFSELADRFAYKELRKVLAFFFHSLGSDLKSQGPSIPPGLLHRLLTEVRSLQAILGVYQFFRARMKLVGFLFKRDGIEQPASLNFELIAKQFVGLLQERYPTGDKVLQSANKLGIEKWILAKIIMLSQFRDAIREIALSQLYRNVQHRDELYNAIIEALEQLEDELDELREKEEEEREREESGEDEDEKDKKKE